MQKQITVPPSDGATLVNINVRDLVESDITTELVPIEEPEEPNENPVIVMNTVNNSEVVVGNQIPLSATISDPDGAITSTQWTQLSGPVTTIANPSSSNTTAVAQAEGTYIFRVQAVDNDLGVATKEVMIRVVANTPPPPSGDYGQLVYQNPYDTSSNLSANQLGQGSISTTVKKDGAGSFKSLVNGNSTSNVSSGWRSEQQYGSLQTPQEGVVEYDCLFEKINGGNGAGHAIQWHPSSSSGSAVLSLFVYEGKFNVVRSIGGTNYHQSDTLKNITLNQWYKLRWEYKFSTGNDGYVRLFIDNSTTPYFQFTGKTTTGGTYLKVGQNRWSYTGGAVNTETVIYYDNLKVWKRV